MMSDNVKCEYCNSLADIQLMSIINETYYVECPVCGCYEYKKDYIKPEYKDMTAAYLYHHNGYKREKDDLSFYFLGEGKDFKKEFHRNMSPKRFVSNDEIQSFYPTQFADRVIMSLSAIARKTTFFGEEIDINNHELCSLLFVRRYNNVGEKYPAEKVDQQRKKIIEYLAEQKYISRFYHDNDIRIQLLPDGWQLVERSQTSETYNKNVFVSMSFASSTKKTRDAIRQGIINAGFSPEFIDEIIHNRQIVPEMLRLIRECRLLILEITEPNYGAYYEAGYALGLGKEVIICCSEEVFRRKYETEEEKKLERYMKPHFDIAQKQILVWKDYKDLTHKLEEWIKELIR